MKIENITIKDMITIGLFIAFLIYAFDWQPFQAFVLWMLWVAILKTNK